MLISDLANQLHGDLARLESSLRDVGADDMQGVRQLQAEVAIAGGIGGADRVDVPTTPITSTPASAIGGSGHGLSRAARGPHKPIARGRCPGAAS